MNKPVFNNRLILLLLIILFSVFLTGCIEVFPPFPTEYGTVKIEIVGDYKYDITMDGKKTQYNNVLPGTYTLYDIPSGYHEFEAIDIMGASFGSDKERIFVEAGRTNYVYLNPVSPTPPATGTLKVVIMDDGGFAYKVYLGGDQHTGEYLGQTSGSYIFGQNSATFTGIPSGVQTIFVISSDGKYSKYRFPKIVAGQTITIDIYVKP